MSLCHTTGTRFNKKNLLYFLLFFNKKNKISNKTTSLVNLLLLLAVARTPRHFYNPFIDNNKLTAPLNEHWQSLAVVALDNLAHLKTRTTILCQLFLPKNNNFFFFPTNAHTAACPAGRFYALWNFEVIWSERDSQAALSPVRGACVTRRTTILYYHRTHARFFFY